MDAILRFVAAHSSEVHFTFNGNGFSVGEWLLCMGGIVFSICFAAILIREGAQERKILRLLSTELLLGMIVGVLTVDITNAVNARTVLFEHTFFIFTLLVAATSTIGMLLYLLWAWLTMLLPVEYIGWLGRSMCGERSDD